MMMRSPFSRPLERIAGRIVAAVAVAIVARKAAHVLGTGAFRAHSEWAPTEWSL